MNRKILLFIPMYNCEAQIGRVLGKIGPEARKNFAEILVADNRSLDASVDLAGRALSGISGVRTVLVKNRGNYGLGGSLKVAFNYCLDQGYDRCVVLHGDDQAELGDLLPYLENADTFGYDYFFGSRFDNGSKLTGYSRVRTLGNKVLNLLASFAAGRCITDLGSGLNMYNVSRLKDRFYLRFPDDLTFDVYMLLHCLWGKANFKFFPITWSESDQRSNAKAVRQGLTILGLLLRYRLNAASVFAADRGRAAGNYGFNVVYDSALSRNSPSGS